MTTIIRLTETTSTSDALRQMADRGEAPGDFTTVVADFQTSGRGQVGNHWESEAGKNLLVSTLVRPRGIDVSRHFTLSMAVSLAVADAVADELPPRMRESVKIKWPNDIYAGHGKLAGILVENRLSGRHIVESVIGVGVNVNQERFLSDAPNPVSIKGIAGRGADLDALLDRYLASLRFRLTMLGEGDEATILRHYASRLYRGDFGFHPFADASGAFDARIVSVAPDGRLTLERRDGQRRDYLFKEVEHIVPTTGGKTVTPNLKRGGAAVHIRPDRKSVV